MTQDVFLNLARSAARRATERVSNQTGQIGNLVLTQTGGKGEPTVREPEIRTAFQHEADSHAHLYGIEVPTFCTYRFSGKGYRRALTDFALLDSAEPNAVRGVLVEFKAGQPQGSRDDDGIIGEGDDNTEGAGSVVVDVMGDGGTTVDSPAIRKDLHKLLAEPVHYGRCMFHVCHAEDAGTVPALVTKYNGSMIRAIRDAKETRERCSHVVRGGSVEDNVWLVLMILAIRQRGKKRVTEGSRLYLGVWDEQAWKVKQDLLFA